MKKIKILPIFAGILLIISLTFCLTSCWYEYKVYTDDKWKKKYDISLPNFENAGDNQNNANSTGWYCTMNENFDDESWHNLWKPVRNYLRNEEYWCDKMISQSDGKIQILAEESTEHNEKYNCGHCGDKSNYYTSGIATCSNINDDRNVTFEQAFGYFEARVQFPQSGGMWSAFWLYTTDEGNIGHGGKDGAEIDIYESSFWGQKDYVGNCIHYDGYGEKHKAGMAMHSVGYDLYEGYHTFALKWTPKEYVFYVDNVAVWATDFGGICKVPAYIKLTNEIRQKANNGPYSQPLDKFTGGTFYIDYVKVYQNVNYLSHIKSAEDFK